MKRILGFGATTARSQEPTPSFEHAAKNEQPVEQPTEVAGGPMSCGTRPDWRAFAAKNLG